VAAGQRLHGPRVLHSDVVERLVGDVLANALLALTLDPDGRRSAREVGRGLELLALELVALDLERQVGELVERAQRGTFLLPLR
jgi:hypothetical protein